MAFAIAKGSSFNQKLAQRSAILFFMGVLSLCLLLLGVGLWLSHRIEQQELQHNQVRYLHVASSRLHYYLLDALSDLLIVSQKREMLGENPHNLKQLQKEFMDIANVRHNLAQLRLLDAQGMEKVRVNFSGDQAYAVSDDELQDKHDRYYFQKTMQLKPGEVYISPLDLNIEHGQLEQPLNPMLRVATPVIDLDRHRFVLVFNLYAQYMLDMLKSFDDLKPAQLMLVNEEGYWLYHQDGAKMWGQQLPHGQSFSHDYADAWRTIRHYKVGQFFNTQGLFTFHLVGDIASQSLECDSCQPHVLSMPSSRLHIVQDSGWYLVAYVPVSAWYVMVKSTQMWLILAGICCVLVLLIPVSLLWGKRKAQNLYEQERNLAYQNIIEHSDELIYIVNLEGKIIFVNHAFERCTGYMESDVLGKPASVLRSGRHPEEFYKLLWQQVMAGQVFESIFVNKKKDGTLFYEEKRIMPVLNDEGAIEYFVSLGRDLSERYETRLHEMQITSQLSDSVSHHFNNLLTGIMGYINLSMMKIDSHDMVDVKATLQQSLDIAVNAEGLIAKISKARHHGGDGLAKINIQPILLKVAVQWQAQLPDYLDFECDIADLLPMIPAEAELLETALMALLQNAQEALMGMQGIIRMQVQRCDPPLAVCINCGEPINGQSLEICIQDTGCGIEPAHMARIFDPFFTTKQSAKLVAQTPGLGLTMVRGIVHSHHGHILLTSEMGVGTMVRLLFPCHS